MVLTQVSQWQTLAGDLQVYRGLWSQDFSEEYAAQQTLRILEGRRVMAIADARPLVVRAIRTGNLPGGQPEYEYVESVSVAARPLTADIASKSDNELPISLALDRRSGQLGFASYGHAPIH